LNAFHFSKPPYNDNYGSPSVGIRCSAIMGKQRWLHKSHRKLKDLNHASTKVQEQENLIKQDFQPQNHIKNCLWISDRFHVFPTFRSRHSIYQLLIQKGNGKCGEA